MDTAKVATHVGWATQRMADLLLGARIEHSTSMVNGDSEKKNPMAPLGRGDTLEPLSGELPTARQIGVALSLTGPTQVPPPRSSDPC